MDGVTMTAETTSASSSKDRSTSSAPEVPARGPVKRRWLERGFDANRLAHAG